MELRELLSFYKCAGCAAPCAPSRGSRCRWVEPAAPAGAACPRIPGQPLQHSSRFPCSTPRRFPGDEIPIVRGSALAALKGENDKIGK